MQSMKVDTQPRPSLLSWFKNLSVSHQSRVQFYQCTCSLSIISVLVYGFLGVLTLTLTKKARYLLKFQWFCRKLLLY